MLFHSFLFSMTSAPMTPGTHPAQVRMRTMSTDPHPRSMTASGGKKMARRTRKMDIAVRFFEWAKVQNYAVSCCVHFASTIPARMNQPPPRAARSGNHGRTSQGSSAGTMAMAKAGAKGLNRLKRRSISGTVTKVPTAIGRPHR